MIVTLLCVAAGYAAGRVFFTGLAANVELYLSGRGRTALVLHAARLTVIAGLALVAARLGALPLLGALAGFVAARTVAVRREP